MQVKSLRSLMLDIKSPVEFVMVNKNDNRTLHQMKLKFGYHDLDLADTAPPLQSTKLAVRKDYLFMILLYPVYDRKSKTISSAEVDFYIEKDRVTVVDPEGLPQLKEFCASLEKGEKEQPQDVPHLLYLILETMIEEIYPMLRHISADVEEIESKLFRNFERSLIKDLLRVKTNIVSVRKSIQGHKNVIRKLVAEASGRYLSVRKLEEYFDKLVEETKDIWDRLELQKNTIDALHETNASLLDYQTNEIMKTLTIISVITFPLTLFATLFATRAAGMPIVDNPYGFWILAAIVAILAIAMLAVFKKKNWL